jgi:hypothetical protein
MDIYASSHPDYFTFTPSISIGHGWAMLDWMWWTIDITRGEIPF